MCGTFYFSGIAQDYDWTSPQNTSLWQDDVKTLFDPCPSGWRVPFSGDETSRKSPWNAFTMSNGPWKETGNTAGRRWTSPQVVNSTVWYTTYGFRPHSSGLLTIPNTWIHAWTSTAQPLYVYCFRISKTEYIPDLLNYRASGYSVRCLRE